MSDASKPQVPRWQGFGWRAIATRLAILFAIGLAALPDAAHAAIIQPMPIGPLVQVIDTDERDDHADISVQFSCSVRYIANTPISHGNHTAITLRLGPDCGNLLNAFLPEPISALTSRICTLRGSIRAAASMYFAEKSNARGWKRSESR